MFSDGEDATQKKLDKTVTLLAAVLLGGEEKGFSFIFLSGEDYWNLWQKVVNDESRTGGLRLLHGRHELLPLRHSTSSTEANLFHVKITPSSCVSLEVPQMLVSCKIALHKEMTIRLRFNCKIYQLNAHPNSILSNEAGACKDAPSFGRVCCRKTMEVFTKRTE